MASKKAPKIPIHKRPVPAKLTRGQLAQLVAQRAASRELEQPRLAEQRQELLKKVYAKAAAQDAARVSLVDRMNDERAILKLMRDQPALAQTVERLRTYISLERLQKARERDVAAGRPWNPSTVTAYFQKADRHAHDVGEIVFSELDKRGYAIPRARRAPIVHWLLFGSTGRLLEGMRTNVNTSAHPTRRYGRSNKPSEHQATRVRKRERD